MFYFDGVNDYRAHRVPTEFVAEFQTSISALMPKNPSAMNQCNHRAWQAVYNGFTAFLSSTEETAGSPLRHSANSVGACTNRTARNHAWILPDDDRRPCRPVRDAVRVNWVYVIHHQVCLISNESPVRSTPTMSSLCPSRCTVYTSREAQCARTCCGDESTG